MANANADLDSRTNLAVTTLRNTVSGTSSINATSGNELTRAVSTLASYTSGAAASMTRTGVSNINTLIGIANTLNSNSSRLPALVTLQKLLSDGQRNVSSHSIATLTNQIQNLANQRDWLSRLIFDASSRFNNSVVNPTVTSVSTSSTNRASNLLRNTMTNLNNTISTNYLAAQIASVNAGIQSAVSNFNSTYPQRIAERNNRASEQFTPIFASANDLRNYIVNNNTAINDIATRNVASSSTNSTVNSYNTVATNATQLTRIAGTNYTIAQQNFASSASLQLSNLTSRITQAQSYMSSGSGSASSDSSNDVMSQVVSSMASVGNVQQQINNALLQRNSENLNAMQNLTNKLQASQVSFINMTNSITALTRELSGSVNSSNPSSSKAANMIVNAMDNLNNVPVLVEQQASKSKSIMSQTASNVSNSVKSYSTTISDRFKQYFSSPTSIGTLLKSNITFGVSNSSRGINDQLSLWRRYNSDMDNRSKSVLNDIATASSSLGKRAADISTSIASVASYIPIATTSLSSNIATYNNTLSSLFAGIGKDLTTNIDLTSSQFTPLIAAADSHFETFMTHQVAGASDSFSAHVEVGKKVLAEVNNSFIPQVVSSVGSIPNSPYDEKLRSALFSADLVSGPETTMNRTIDDFTTELMASTNSGGINGQESVVKSAITSSLQPGQFDDIASSILDRVSEQSENLLLVSNMVPLVIEILKLTDPLFDEKTGLKTFTEVAKYINASKLIDSIKLNEINVLSNLLTDSLNIQKAKIGNIVTNRDSMESAFWKSVNKISPLEIIRSANSSLLASYSAALGADNYLANRPTSTMYTFGTKIGTKLDPIVSWFSKIVDDYRAGVDGRVRELQAKAKSLNLDPDKYVTQHTSGANKILDELRKMVARSSATAAGALLDALDTFQGSMNELHSDSTKHANAISLEAKNVLTNSLNTVNDTVTAESILEQAEANSRNIRQNSIMNAVNQISSLTAFSTQAFVNAIQKSVSDTTGLTTIADPLPIVTGRILSEWIAANLASNSSATMLESLSSDHDTQIELGTSRLKTTIMKSTGDIRTVSDNAKSLTSSISTYDDSLAELQKQVESESDSTESAIESILSDSQVDTTRISPTNYQSEESKMTGEIQAALDDVSGMIKTAR